MLQLISQPSGACRNLSTSNNLRMFKLKRNETDRTKMMINICLQNQKYPHPQKENNKTKTKQTKQTNIKNSQLQKKESKNTN